MRFTINREQLLKGLTLVSKAVPPKAEVPILQNMKLSLTERGLEILGSDIITKRKLCFFVQICFLADSLEIIAFPDADLEFL